MTTRHEFLTDLHELLQPAVYLEIGVQHGWSLALAKPPCRAVGVDPDPRVIAPVAHSSVVLTCTADEFFTDGRQAEALGGPVDLAFIDGMHLFEYALRDFMGCERLSRPGATIVFDDVLPRNQMEASRRQCPGDWAGDVWRIHPYLQKWRPSLELVLVDTFPTGVLVVRNLHPDDSTLSWQYIRDAEAGVLEAAPPVPHRVLDRTEAVSPEVALRMIHDERQQG